MLCSPGSIGGPRASRNLAGIGGLQLMPSLPIARISFSYTGNVSPNAFSNVGLADGISSDARLQAGLRRPIRWPGNFPIEVCRKHASLALYARRAQLPVPVPENSGQSTNSLSR